MEKYKYQIAAILLAIIIGAVGGSIFTGNQKNREIRELNEKHKEELKKNIELATEAIKTRNKKIKELEEISTHDSLVILQLHEQIKQDGVRVEQRRREAAKLSRDEKVRWLNDWAANQPSN